MKVYVLNESRLWEEEFYTTILGVFATLAEAQNAMETRAQEMEEANAYCYPDYVDDDDIDESGYILDGGYKSGPKDDAGLTWAFTCGDSDGIELNIVEAELGATLDVGNLWEDVFPKKIRKWNKEHDSFILE